MDESSFWGTVDSCTQHGDPASREKALVAKLKELPIDEILGFEHCWSSVKNRAYRADLWGAAYVLNGGCSDDGFVDFRTWLILQGQAFFDQALADPDYLAELLPPGGDEFSHECYPAVTAYEAVTGQKPARFYEVYAARFGRAPHLELVGELWDFDDEEETRKRLPRLAARCL